MIRIKYICVVRKLYKLDNFRQLAYVIYIQNKELGSQYGTLWHYTIYIK